MTPITQTRTGRDGNCFAACLASILETKPPEFGSGADFWPRVDHWLALRGLQYTQVPVDVAAKPLGWHTIEGTSPRGGQHAIVGYNGRPVFDPHPQDGTGRGLAEQKCYGILTRRD